MRESCGDGVGDAVVAIDAAREDPVRVGELGEIGFFNSTSEGSYPSASISQCTLLESPLSKTTNFIGSSKVAMVLRSPSCMVSPPSPHIATTWRSGKAT